MEEQTEEKQVFSRRTRSSDTREANSRAASERAPISFGTGTGFNLPQSVLDDKRFRFSFKEYSVRGVEDYARCESAEDSGWDAVESADYPALKRSYKCTARKRTRDTDDDLVRYQGQICYRRLEELCAEEDRQNDEKKHHDETILSAYKKDSPYDSIVDGYSRKKARIPVL
jgi:hypothetical protein